jgi:hypothetical protein
MAAGLVVRWSVTARALAASAALSSSVLPLQAADAYKVRLTPVPIEASTSAATKGSGNASATLDGTTLRLRGSFSGMQGPATVARLHEGRVTGVRGPSIADFTVPQAASGSFDASIPLTAAQLDSLRQGRLYLQIHSSAAPDGNLWGWLLP